MDGKKPLSYSLVDYIEAIDTLTRQHGHAHTKEIAAQLKVKMPSVTVALQHLASRGYIHYSSHKPVELTPQGQRVADRIARNHRTLEHFFQRILALPPETAHQASSSIDHILQDEVVRRFILFSRAIATRTDCRALATHLSEAMEYLNADPANEHAVIAALTPGTQCVFERASTNLADSAEVQRLGLAPGTTLTAGDWTLDQSAITVFDAQSGKRWMIPAAVAENLWVKVLGGDLP